MKTLSKTTDGEGFGEAAHFSAWEDQMRLGSTTLSLFEQAQKLDMAWQAGKFTTNHAINNTNES